MNDPYRLMCEQCGGNLIVHALGVKCIYALHEIGTDKAREKLQLLAKVDNAEMSERARRLLARV